MLYFQWVNYPRVDQQELAQVVSSLMSLKGGLEFESHRMQKLLLGRLTHQSQVCDPGRTPMQSEQSSGKPGGQPKKKKLSTSRCSIVLINRVFQWVNNFFDFMESGIRIKSNFQYFVNQITLFYSQNFFFLAQKKKYLGPVLPSLFSVQFSSFQFSSIQFSSDQFSSVQFSSVQFSSVQFSSVQFSSVQFSCFMPKRTYPQKSFGSSKIQWNLDCLGKYKLGQLFGMEEIQNSRKIEFPRK